MRRPEPGGARRRASIATLLVAVTVLGCAAPHRGSPLQPPSTPEAALVLPDDAAGVEVWVRGGVAPMAGRVVEVEGERRFEPRFPWLVGVTYELRAGDDAELLGSFLLPEKVRPRPRCLGRDPVAEVLPENLLRLYLRFSAPMARGEVRRRVRLLESGGDPLENVFLDLPQELWNPEGTRLTLLFDPGRVKRGLRTHRELGRALEAGRRYVLALDGDWPDVYGNTLGGDVHLPFAVGPPDTEPPDPTRWSVRGGTPGTREPLRVRLEAAADRDLLRRLLRVEVSGRVVPGAATVDGTGLEYSFVPEQPWSVEPAELVVPQNLEDWVGHRPGRLFEVLGGAEAPDDPLREWRLSTDGQAALDH